MSYYTEHFAPCKPTAEFSLATTKCSVCLRSQLCEAFVEGYRRGIDEAFGGDRVMSLWRAWGFETKRAHDSIFWTREGDGA